MAVAMATNRMTIDRTISGEERVEVWNEGERKKKDEKTQEMKGFNGLVDGA